MFRETQLCLRQPTTIMSCQIDNIRLLSYCCNEKCFRVPEDQVDGKACDKCNSYCYCRCSCKTYQKNRLDKLEELAHRLSLLWQRMMQKD